MTRPKTGSRKTLALLILALAALLWSTFLWWELVQARGNGSDPFCAFGDPGSCGELWDGPLAAWVHRWTGVPIAGWGAIWGLAALFLTLRVRARKAPWGTLRWIGGAGVLAVAGLAAASLLEGAFCSSCFLAYLLAGAFGGLAWAGKGESKERGTGRGRVALALLGAYLLALIPGLETPKSTATESRQALEAAAAASSQGAASLPKEPVRSPGASMGGLPSRFTQGPGTGDEARDRQLATLIGNLSPQLRQAMSDLLVDYDRAPAFEEAPPRALEGSAEAPVHIVEFTDTLCSHCATLFESLHQLREVSPARSFSVDQRHYPLDGNCNRNLPVRGPESVRCLAARAKVCFEGREGSQAFTGELYREQEELTEMSLWEIAGKYGSLPELKACVKAPETLEAVATDVELASRYRPRGTPLVIVNGKEARAFTPLLYALILNGGSVSHPAFSALPAPSH